MQSPKPEPWYNGITRYQILVLVIASAGWVFDVYEGQIFNLTRTQLLSEVLDVTGNHPDVKRYGDVFLGVFLVGGAVGGVFFGSLADRWGRGPTMIVTILMYSIFSGLTYFAQSLWEVGVLRFLVAMGVGGEWAVAAVLVAEVFPQRARAQASAIFHGTSLLGTWLAALVALGVGSRWRYAYLIGVLPTLLVLWVRIGIREPESWTKIRRQSPTARPGSLVDLLVDRRLRHRAIFGMLLAAVGLGSFWSITVAGQDLARDIQIRAGVPESTAIEHAKFAYGILQVFGGGIGLVAFGPLCAWLGRRTSFILIQALALMIVPITCYLPSTYTQLLILLPIFGFLTLGMHAGYAIYFPELFPTHLRATGAGFCFNSGRLVAASMLIFSGWVKAQPGIDLRLALSLLALVFLPGIGVVFLLPETKGQPLPEEGTI